MLRSQDSNNDDDDNNDPSAVNAAFLKLTQLPMTSSVPGVNNVTLSASGKELKLDAVDLSQAEHLRTLYDVLRDLKVRSLTLTDNNLALQFSVTSGNVTEPKPSVEPREPTLRRS